MQSKALVILVGTGIMLIIGVQPLLALTHSLISKDHFIQQAFVTHMETTN